MGKKLSHTYIYKAYREYMRRKYGPGPWVHIDPDDRFVVWRSRTFRPSEIPEDVTWKEVYRDEVNRRRQDKPPRSNRNRKGGAKDFKSKGPVVSPHIRTP